MDRGDIPIKAAAEAATLPPEQQDAVVADINAGEKPKRALRKQKARPPKEAIKDALGVVIPDTLRDVFADPYLAECVNKANGWADAFAYKSMLVTIQRRIRHLPYLRIDDLQKRCSDAEVALDSVLVTLRAGLPWCVCPACQGHGCADCRQGGYLPEWRHLELYGEGGEAR